MTDAEMRQRIIDRLKERARTRGCSLESELRDLLAQSSRQPLILDPLAEADRIAAMTPRDVPQTDSVVLLRAAGGER